ncbi:MAG: phage tail tube protein [Treponema sp.]|nr:phage tail tube protein [Treponema sp.]
MRLERVHRVISSRLGELPLQEGASTFKPAGKKRETRAGEVPENTGFTESQTFAELKLKLNATGALGVEEFSDEDEDTLTIWTTGGKQYMMPRAWVTEPGELGNAEIDITYNSGISPRLQ